MTPQEETKKFLFSKTALIVILVLLCQTIFLLFTRIPKKQKPKNTITPTAASTKTVKPDPNAAAAGEHCGGNTATATSCMTGYHCAPEPASHLPFGDVGGICIKD